MHRKQLKQLQVALQTSLNHIRGLKVSVSPPRGTLFTSHQVLMEQSSTASIQSEIDEAALKDLLQLVPNRPRLTGLKLCLADLRRDVKELNLQLGDRYCKYFSHYFTSCQVSGSHPNRIFKDGHAKFLGEIQPRLCREFGIGDTISSPLLSRFVCSAESTACWQEMKSKHNTHVRTIFKIISVQ